MITKERTYEADNRTSLNHEGQNANTPVMRLSASSIIGDHVQNKQRQWVGKIKDVMINIHNGKIEYFVIEFGSFLGLNNKLFAIPLPEFSLNENRRMFVLDRTKEYLKESPGFDKSHWPDTNLHRYFDDVNSYYSMPVLRVGYK